MRLLSWLLTLGCLWVCWRGWSCVILLIKGWGLGGGGGIRGTCRHRVVQEEIDYGLWVDFKTDSGRGLLPVH